MVFLAHLDGRPPVVAGVARFVVLADFSFTATVVIAQTVTGYLLARIAGYSMWEGWIVLSLILYVITGLFWLPVVWIQIHMRDLAEEAVARGISLPAAYHRYFWTWFGFGFPAFGAVAAIFWLMIARPDIRFGKSLRSLGADRLSSAVDVQTLSIGVAKATRLLHSLSAAMDMFRRESHSLSILSASMMVITRLVMLGSAGSSDRIESKQS